MIKHFQENDFVELFLDCPIYIGEEQGGELIFKREYDNGLSLIMYIDVYGEKIELSISFTNQNIATFSSNVDEVQIESFSIYLMLSDKKIAEVFMEPYPYLSIHGQ